MKRYKYLLRLLVSVRPNAIRIPVFLSPEAFDDTTIDLCVMGRLDGMRRRLLSSELNKSISLILEYSDILDGAKWRKSFGYQLICYPIRESSAVDCTVGRTALVVNLWKNKRIGIRNAERNGVPKSNGGTDVPYLLIIGFAVSGMPGPLGSRRWRLPR